MTENTDEKRLSYLTDRLISQEMSDGEAEELLLMFQQDHSLPTVVYDQLQMNLLLTQSLKKQSPDAEFGPGTFPPQGTMLDAAFNRPKRTNCGCGEIEYLPSPAQSNKKHPFSLRHIVIPLVLVNVIFILALASYFYNPKQGIPPKIVATGQGEPLVGVPLPDPLPWHQVADSENDPTEMSQAETYEQFSKAVAVIKEIQNVGWVDGSKTYQVGDFIDPGWFRMASGHVTIDFFSGASVQLEGECDLNVISPYLVVCQKGRVVSEVSEQAIGFRINTPQIDIIDRGTSFALDVSGDQTKVNVIQGKIELAGLSEGNIYLEEGEAMSIDRFGNTTSFNGVESEQLELTLASLRKLESRENLHRYERWKKQEEFLRTDPSLVARFVFGNIPTDTRIVNNAIDKTVTRDHSASDGFIVRGKITEGRWKEKPALQLGRVSDRMRFSLPGNYDAMTLAAWVRIDGLNQSYNTLFSTFGFAQGEVHWHVYHEGKIAIDINSDNALPITKIVSDVLITPDRVGQWIHLGAVLDLKTNQASIFFNGEKKHSERFRMSRPFQFGNCELGNWSAPPLWYRQYPVRSFGGAMDEFLFFSRAFSDEEMKKLATEAYP